MIKFFLNKKFIYVVFVFIFLYLKVTKMFIVLFLMLLIIFFLRGYLNKIYFSFFNKDKILIVLHFFEKKLLYFFLISMIMSVLFYVSLFFSQFFGILTFFINCLDFVVNFIGLLWYISLGSMSCEYIFNLNFFRQKTVSSGVELELEKELKEKSKETSSGSNSNFSSDLEFYLWIFFGIIVLVINIYFLVSIYLLLHSEWAVPINPVSLTIASGVQVYGYSMYSLNMPEILEDTALLNNFNTRLQDQDAYLATLKNNVMLGYYNKQEFLDICSDNVSNCFDKKLAIEVQKELLEKLEVFSNEITEIKGWKI